LSEHSDPTSVFLWDSLSESDQSLLRSYQPSPPSSKQAQEVIVQALQKLVGGPSIYKVGRFKGVSLRPETAGLTYERPTGFKLAHFNRLLLEDAYPLELWRTPPKNSGLERNVREAIDSIEKLSHSVVLPRITLQGVRVPPPPERHDLPVR
jgi:hypothetical protein